MSRTNHKDLHKKLSELGYELYMLDYKDGAHHYQFQKDNEWNEYSVNTNKKIIIHAVQNEDIVILIKEHYEKQGYTVKLVTE